VADPRRILLMTFSRRAASEMTKRVERIARKVMGDNAGVMTDALAWAGTFPRHRARGFCATIQTASALDPAFTIHDREDFCRRDETWSGTKRASRKTKKPLPDQGNLPFDLLAVRQCRDGDRTGAGSVIPVVLRMGC